MACLLVKDELTVTIQLAAVARPETLVFWGASPPEDTDFLPLDPLALDYLGQQVGLWLLPAFTTRTDRAQYYAVVLYGLSLVDQISPNATDEERVKLFERWERFWALSVLESRNGDPAQGSPDAFRGLRGATKVWRPGDAALGLDYPLISRQSELGGLGAYLSSLREYKLVLAGTYRPTPLANEIVEAFWDEPDSNARRSAYEAYALAAMDMRRSKIDRKMSNISLAEVGRRARLSVLVDRKRSKQQERLFQRLFSDGPGQTSRIGELILAAAREDVLATESVLEGALDDRWGDVDPALKQLLSFSLVFGRASKATLDAFHALYASVLDGAWVVDLARAVALVFDDARLETLRSASKAFLDSPLSSKFQSLPVHASGFVALQSTLASAGADEAFSALMRYHQQVQTERRSGPGWLREEGGKLIADMATYTGYRAAASFPSLKFPAVRRLLLDTGRLP